jgi:hypothetical protein
MYYKTKNIVFKNNELPIASNMYVVFTGHHQWRIELFRSSDSSTSGESNPDI